MAAETGVRLPTDMREIAADQRRLIEGIEALRAAGRLADLAHALAPVSGPRKDSPAAEVTALAERIRAAARRPNVAPEIRERSRKCPRRCPRTAGNSDLRKSPLPTLEGRGTRAAISFVARDAAPWTSPTIQSLRESDAGAGVAGPMTSKGDGDVSKKTSPGLGLGGGSDREHEAARIAGLEAVLRRATIEADTEGAGQTLRSDARHNTDRGEATAAYTHSAAGGIRSRPCRRASGGARRAPSGRSSLLHPQTMTSISVEPVHRAVPRSFRPDHPRSRRAASSDTTKS